ncbi:glycosyl transferase [Acinetobacter halotolerans]|uniref:Glycosyl transferase n=1 Tax=Acinetobacter halotolerans TaxID=1752076 RepID=A0A4Q6XGC4_9GAMM|nr:glycosyltransferase family 25 protein [Acinetobacter halotolerans]RZF50804.1 glycosyl transferase [Acinetobacter halotolerans]
MKNFVISLTYANQRRDHISSIFEKQSIEFSFFDAVTPDTMEQVAKDLNVDITKTELAKSEIACLLSHAALWKKTIDENLSYIAIFEDDIHLGEEAIIFLTKSDWIPEGCSIIKLEAFYPKVGVESSFKSLPSKRKLSLLKTVHMGCGGYILSQQSARDLLCLLTNYEKLIPVDHIVFKDYMMTFPDHVYQMLPALCIQDHLLGQHVNFPSFLEQDRNIRKGEYEYQIKPKLNFIQKIQREGLRLSAQIIKLLREFVLMLKGKRLTKVKFK